MEISNTSNYYVYILANTSRNTFLIDTTANLIDRIQELTNTKPEDKVCKDLLYYELYDIAMKAIKREDQLKRFSVSKLLKLIQVQNPKLNPVENFKEIVGASLEQ